METYQHNGVEYGLGCLPRTAPLGALPCLADAIKIIPRDQWRPRNDMPRLVPSVLNQGSHGACVAFGCTQGVKVLRRIAGLPDVDLSPWDLYRRICGGRDAGASISDGLARLRDEGVCTTALCPSFTLSGRKTPEWAADAGKHRVQEWFDCPTRETIATALQLGFVVPFGVPVTSSWEPGPDGWLNPRGGVRGGHCILGLGFVCKDGRWGVPFVNSWTEGWGIKGWAIYPLDLIDNDYADAWAGRAATYSNA
jgi:hypothetical protein